MQGVGPAGGNLRWDSELLSSKGIQTFLLLVAHLHRWSDRQKRVELPLFPCHAFVRTALAAELRHAVLRTPGVIGFVEASGKGLPISDKEIEDLRLVMAQKAPRALYPFLRVGQRVRVRGGALDGLEGILVACNSNRSLAISVSQIQHSVLIRIEAYDVELI